MRLASLLVSSQLALGTVLDRRQSSSNACATAMKLVQSSETKVDNQPVIGGQAAYNCLMSIPFNSSKAKKFITEVKKYVQFQSTLDVLKDPPSTYSSPATDILGGLDKIAANDYDSQYEFDTDLSKLFSTANDGHFSIVPCTLTGFNFFRAGSGLASFSKDGLEKPDIYIAEDIPVLLAGSSAVSPITSINGQDVIKYLEAIAAGGMSQDPDARWNALFTSAWSLAAIPDSAKAYLGQFAYDGGRWPGTNNTSIDFKNGSSIELATMAKYTPEKTASSGSALGSLLCDPPSTSTNARREASPVTENKRAETTYDAGPRAYPTPVYRDPQNLLVEFNLDKDTEVMLIPSFESPGDGNEGFESLSQTATKIVNTAVANGRTKLIIDVSANPGGTIARAFDLFKLFFPKEFPYSATRMRRHDALDTIVLALQNQDTKKWDYSPFWWKEAVSPLQDKDFKSVDDFLKGDTELGSNVTSLFANFNYTSTSENHPNQAIRGYNGTPINDTQPFKPENILIITDGVCASTCTTFVNLMTNVGGVRAVSFGGRPRLEPMQAMGGVRGAQSFSFASLDTIIALGLANVNANQELLTPEQLSLGIATVPNSTALPYYIPSGNFNLRNAYQEGDDDLPLQFQYQASDCRLFYTADSIQNPEKIWTQAKTAVWDNKGCVSNSTGGKGSLDDRNKNKSGNSGPGNGNGNGGKDKKSGGDISRPGSIILGVLAFVSAYAAL